MPQPSLPNEKSKLYGLDHLRALAITFVFLFHYRLFAHPDWEGQVTGFGWTGVDLFFVLSGFLIAGQLFASIAKGKAVSLREFFLKRFFRIIPPYLVVLTLYFVFPSLREGGNMAPLWKYLTFTLNLSLNLRQVNTFTHSWSLCIEEQFYLLLPLIILLFNYFKIGKKAVYLLIALFIAGFIIRALSWDYLVAPTFSTDHFNSTWHQYIYYPTYNRLDPLLIGVGIAGLFTFYPAIKTRADKLANYLLAAGIAILIACYFLCKDDTSYHAAVFGFPLIAIAFGCIVAAVVCPSCIFYRIQSRLTAQIATLSYSIYLSHKMIIHTTQNLLGNMGIARDGNLMLALCIISSVLGALVLRYVVELPALRIRDKVISR